MEYCENQNLFDEVQSTYKIHRCTTYDINELTQQVSEAVQWTEMFGFVCLDVEKLFHAVWCLGLVHKTDWANYSSHELDKFFFIAKERACEDHLNCQ